MEVSLVISIYLVTSTILLGFTAMIWSSKDAINCVVKLVFLMVTLMGAVLIAKDML